MSVGPARRGVYRAWPLLIITIAIGACSPGVRNPDILYAPALGMADPVPSTIADTPYRLAAQDRFNVTVYRMPELSREYRVEPSGIVNFPLVGDVQVAGLTSTELAALLTERYNRTQLRNPSISVQIGETRARTVTVEGSVRTPGAIAVAGTTTLLDMVARAGGTAEYANEKRVIVFRQVNGVRQAAAFDLRQVREGLMDNPAIYAGDIVIVDGSELRRDMRDFLMAVPILGLFNPFR